MRRQATVEVPDTLHDVIGRRSQAAHVFRRLVRAKAPQRLDAVDNCLYHLSVQYEWDPAKAEANLRTHGVSFPEASRPSRIVVP
jgi:hypothetical protein